MKQREEGGQGQSAGSGDGEGRTREREEIDGAEGERTAETRVEGEKTGDGQELRLGNGSQRLRSGNN